MRCGWILMCSFIGVAAWFLNDDATTSAPARGPAAARVAVTIENYAFQPDPVTVVTGTTVTWTNHDEVAHSVVSHDKVFSSPELEANQSFEYTFKKAGTFAYFCSIHPEMKGKVIVK